MNAKKNTVGIQLRTWSLDQFFTIEDNVCCGLVVYSFYYVEVCSFYSCFLETFDHKWMLNFVKGFLCMDSVGEGEGGKIWENGIETCMISCMK